MVKVKALAECAGCGATQEYWALADVESVDESDTFSRRERPILAFSLPEGWGRSYHGSSSCHCGECIDSMPKNQRDRFRRY